MAYKFQCHCQSNGNTLYGEIKNQIHGPKAQTIGIKLSIALGNLE
jgi:hypothetical protein